MSKVYFKYLLMMLFVVPLLCLGLSANAQDDCYVSLSSNATTINCNYQEVIIIASGSDDSMTYEWSNAETSDRIMASASGVYYVTATTTNGCTASASIAITEDFSVPNVSITSLSGSTTLSCSNDMISLIATGGNSYSWSNGSISSEITVTFPGNYTVTVYGENGCIASSSIDITGSTESPSVYVSGENSLCSGQTAMLTASAMGGMPPYNYIWSDGSNGETANLSAGSYGVTVTDSNGCTASREIVLYEADPIMLSINGSSTICAGESVELTAMAIGGTPDYRYAWSSGENNPSIIVAPTLTTTYIVTATDANGCYAEQDITITVSVPPTISLNSESYTLTCSNPSANIEATVSEGTAPYLYTWSNGETSSSIMANAAGMYLVTATDANGCSAMASATVTSQNDTEAPTIICPSSMTVSTDEGSNTANVILSDVIVDDNTAVDYYINNYNNTQDASGIYELGVTDVVYTVVDICGNSNSCSFTVTVIDNEEPCIGCDPSNIDNPFDPTAGVSCSTITGTEVSPNEGVSTYTHNGSDWDITANDNVGIASIVYSLSGATMNVTQPNTTLNGQVFELGSTTITWTVTDLSGNFSECSFTVTVSDNEPPAINGNNFDRELTSSSCFFVVPDLTEEIRAVSSDNITANSDLVITQDLSAGYQITTTTMVTVTVRDQSGNETSTTVVLSIPNTPTIMVNSRDVVCQGEMAEATVAVTGGTAPYAYNWSDGTTGATANLMVGSYVVTVTDSNGCSAEYSLSVLESEMPVLLLNADATVLTCSTQMSNITATVSGGTAPYVYTWSNGLTTDSIMVSNAGLYSVTLTDANGCEAMQSIVITEDVNVPMLSIVNNSNTTTLGCANTEINLIATGGDAYIWSNGVSTAENIITTAGTYSVTATGTNGCTAYETISITEVPGLTIAVNSNDIVCNGGTTEATVFVNGGAEPYIYSWSNGTMGATATIGAGYYIVTVTDSYGCSAEYSFTVTEPDLLVLSLSADSLSSSNPTANINATVTGGNAPYSYQWSNGSTTSSIQVNEAGVYSVTVVDSHGCSATESVTINSEIDNESPCIGCDPDGIDPFDPTAGISCSTILNTHLSTDYEASTYTHNGSDWDITANDNTGIASITYSLSGATNEITGSNTTLNGQIFELGSTTVTWTVVDLYGNYSDCSFTVTVVDNESPCIGCDPEPNTPENEGVSCTNIAGAGTIEVTPDLEASTYTHNGNDWDITATDNVQVASITYAVSGNDNTTLTAPNTTLDGQVFGLGTTTVTWTVLDDSGNPSTCSFMVNVTDNEPPAINGNNLDRELTSSSCNFIVPDFTEEIRAISSDNTTPSSDLVITQVPEAGYVLTTTTTVMVTVSDLYGNYSSVNINLTIPASPMVALSADNIICSGETGNITTEITSGKPPYSFVWSNGETSQSIGNLSAGTYSLTVTDANGCTAAEYVTIVEPEMLVVSLNASSNTLTCANLEANIEATVSGGTAPYMYTWSNGGTSNSTMANVAGIYSVTATDANGCNANAMVVVDENMVAPMVTINNLSGTEVLTCATTSINVEATSDNSVSYMWSDGVTTASNTFTAVGSYIVTATGTNGCTSATAITITGSTGIPTVSLSATDIACHGGTTTANVMVNGGIEPYNYMWSDGSVGTTANVSAGSYIVTVTDANGCTVTSSIEVSEPEALVSTISSTSIACYGANDGSATVTVTGGTAPYTYNWNPMVAQTPEVTGLAAGTYTVNIVDANGCSVDQSISITEPEAIVVSLNAGTISCAEPTTTINATVMGGTATYSYMWSDGSTMNTIENAVEGVYFVTVVDANGCSASANVEIEGVSGIVATVTVQNAQNADMANGAAYIIVNGGMAPYMVALSQEGNATSYEYVYMTNDFAINNLPAATYSLAITDSYGCRADLNFVIENICNVVVEQQVTDNGTMLHFENVLYPVTVYVDGNTNGTATEDGYMLQNVENGVHNVFVADANGCFANISVYVEGINCDNVNITANVSVTPTTSTTTPNGAAVITVDGGTAPYTFNWSNGNISDSATDLYQGTYIVAVTDANGCVRTVTFNVNYEVEEEEFDELYVTLDYHLEMEQTYTDDGISVIPVAVVYAQAFGGSAPYDYGCRCRQWMLFQDVRKRFCMR